MRVYLMVRPRLLRDFPEQARRAEALGYDGVTLLELTVPPTLSAVAVAMSSTRIDVLTGIFVAFPRSPLVMAQTAWDLAAQSRGRFILGLGTQIKPHITKRFSSPWGRPLKQLREYIQSLRAIWRSFQTGEDLVSQGEYYQFSLSAPFCEPPPPHRRIPIYIAGVNTGLAKLAGELCDGFHVHSFHTPSYLREVLLPAFRQGGGEKTALALSCAVFVVTGRTADEVEKSKIMSKSQIAFYASTPSYSKVLELHGWQDIVPRLNALLRRGRWNEMHTLISDAMLDHFAVTAPPDELPYKVRERYAGLLDRVGFYFPFEPDDHSKSIIWDAAAKAMGN